MAGNARVPTWLAICAVVASQAAFGAYGVVVAKFAQKNHANPLVFSLIRDACSVPLLLLAAVVAEKKILIPTPREMPVFMLEGLVGFFGGQLLYILGVYWAGPNIGSAFQPAMPVWAAFYAIVFRVEKMPPWRALYTWAKLLGVLCAAGGAIGMTVFKPSDRSTSPSPYSNGTNATASPASTTDCHFSPKHNSHDTIIGSVMFLGNTTCVAIGILIQKKLMFMRQDFRFADLPVNVTAWCYLWAAVCMAIAAPFAKYFEQAQCGVKADPWSISLLVTYPIEYAIFVTSVVGYMLITFAVLHIRATLVAAFWPLQV